MGKKLKIEDSEETPICPYCEKELDRILRKATPFGLRRIYFCPHCKKVLNAAEG